MANFVAHSPHQTISPLGDHDLEPSRSLVVFENFDHRRPRPAVLQMHALAQLIERRGDRPTAHLDLVDLGHVIARMKESVAELAIGRHQQEAFGVVIEPPHGKKAIGFVCDQIRDRLPLFRIRERRNDFDRFV